MLLASCYQPHPEGPCVISCETGACPNGLACDNGLCHAAGDVCGPNGVIDASLTDTMSAESQQRDTGDATQCIGSAFMRCGPRVGSMTYQNPIDGTNFSPSVTTFL